VPRRSGIWSSELLEYLAELGSQEGYQLPSIQSLSEQLSISTGKLREQLEVARTMGLINVRPRTGMQLNGYSPTPSIKNSLLFALAINPAYFDEFGVLRNHIEASFWDEAVRLLTSSDIEQLEDILEKAEQKLNAGRIPHEEHRALHLMIYSRLKNSFVLGLLEAYWAGYEAIGLNFVSDYAYLQEVWTYHQKMIEAIKSGKYEEGYQALIEHTGLLQNRPEIAYFNPGGMELSFQNRFEPVLRRKQNDGHSNS